MLEMLEPYATIISAVSALISAVAVLISTGFVIWITCFRKTRRDRIDELKEEIQVKLSEGWAERIIVNDTTDEFFLSLKSKYQKPKYKTLHSCAFDELGYDGRNEVIRIYEQMDKRREKILERFDKSYRERIRKSENLQ